MKLLANLLIFMASASIVYGVAGKFLGVINIFPNVAPISFIIIANTLLLLALVLKLAKD